MKAALVILSVLALLEFGLIVGVCQIAAAEKVRREKAEQLLLAAAKQLSPGALESAIWKWLTGLETGANP